MTNSASLIDLAMELAEFNLVKRLRILKAARHLRKFHRLVDEEKSAEEELEEELRLFNESEEKGKNGTK